jgi:predicted RNase H-like nuclease (RuvC/YqgF family)
MNGKYFVWCSNLIKSNSKEDKMLKMSFEIKRLEEENRQLISDIDEHKMLLSVYENKFNSKVSSNFTQESMNVPPELP